MQIKKCNDDKPKKNYISYSLGKNDYVARICNQCFTEVDDDLEVETISKESFESFKLEVVGQQ